MPHPLVGDAVRWLVYHHPGRGTTGLVRRRTTIPCPIGCDTPVGRFIRPLCWWGIRTMLEGIRMTKRPYFTMGNNDLAALILANDEVARAEGILRTDARIAKGKKPHGKVHSALSKTTVSVPDPAPAPAAPAPAAPAPVAPAEDMIARVVAEAVAAALAARGITPAAPAPAPQDHTDDAAIWAQCLADSHGSRWEAYDRMEAIIGKRKRSRIAAAAGVSAQSVSNALSKFRRGIAPDLSFAGK